jgi:hypothetical protein
MTVNPLLPVSVSIAASATTVCAGTSVTFTATPANGGLIPGYQWKVNGTNVNGATNAAYTFVPANGNAITCTLTSSETCTTGNPAVSNTVTITVNPLLPVSVSIIASATTVCAGTSVTFNATPINGGLIPGYQWKVNGTSVSGATNAAYTFVPVNGNTITCMLTSSATCATGNPAVSNTVTMTVNPLLPVSVSISASATTVCIGTSVTFNAIPVNGGTVPAYQWKVNGTIIIGATNAAYTYVPANGNAVTCTLTSNEACATGNPALSNTITMTVNNMLVIGSVSANQTICATTAPAQLTGTAPLNGTAPVYQWQSSLNNSTFNNINGATTLNYQPGQLTATTYYRQLQNASGTCGGPLPTNTVTMTVNPLLPVSVSIAASANPVCGTTSVTFTASPVNGGLTPAYQWKVNGTNVSGATNATYTFIPANGSQVKCSLTSGEICTSGNPAVSNTVTMTVNTLLITGSVSASQTICTNTVPAQLTGTAPLNGTSPTYQWQSSLNNATFSNINGATMTTYQPGTLTSTTYYRQLQNSSGTCGGPLPTNTIAIAVNPLVPVSVSVAASANPVCAGTSVIYTATPVNGGTNPAFQWSVNGLNVSGATNATYAFVPQTADLISCSMVSNEMCTINSSAGSNAILMTVNPLQPVSVSIAASATTVCSGSSVTLTATPVNGGTNPAYQWKKNGTTLAGATNTTYTFVPANGDAVSCVLISSETCTSGNPATSNILTITVNQLMPVSVSIVPSSASICAGNPVTYTATPVNGGLTPAYQWKVNGTDVSGATNAAYTFIPVIGNAVTCVLTSSETCATGNPATSNTVAVTVNPVLPVSVSISASATTVCAGTSVTFNATPVNGGITPAYQWKVNGTNVGGATNAAYTYVPANGNTVTCTLTSSVACPTGNPAVSNAIVLTVNPLLPVSVSIAASATTVCAGTSVTFNATPVNGGLTPAYLWKVNGTTVSGATNAAYTFVPANGNTVTCTLTSSETCTTGNPALSNAVTVTVNPLLPVSVSIAASATTVCAGTSVTYTATPVNGGLIPAYQWKVNGTSVSGATNAAYTFVPANGNTVSCGLTSSETCTTGNPAISNTVTMTVNPLVTVSVSISASATTVCAGTSVTFTASPVNGGSNPAYQWKVNGTAVGGATNATYSYAPVNGNVVSCQLTSNASCTISNLATSNSITMMVNPLQTVSITAAASANPVYSGTSVTYTTTIVNGGSSPAYQWKVNGSSVSGATAATYTYIPVNNDVVVCVLTSNVTCGSNNPATSNAVTMSVITIPATLVLQNLTVTGTQCYSALQTITVAGGTTTFVVQSGASVTMIAGQKISYLPGAKVKSGAYMHGYITTNGQYCSLTQPSMVSTVTGEDEVPVNEKDLRMKVYPNPTTGFFTLELNGWNPAESFHAEIYNMNGISVMSKEFNGETKYRISLMDVPAGLYFLRIVAKDKVETIKVIKSN